MRRRKVRRVRQDCGGVLMGGSGLEALLGDDVAAAIGGESVGGWLEAAGSAAAFSTSSVGAEMTSCGGDWRRGCCCSASCILAHLSCLMISNWAMQAPQKKSTASHRPQ